MHHNTPSFERRARAGSPRLAARFRRYETRPSGGDAQAGALYWLAVLIAGGIAVVSITLGLSSPDVGADSGKSLQAHGAIPKLNSVVEQTVAPAPAELPHEPVPSPRSSEPRELPSRLTEPRPLPPVDVIPVAAESEPSGDPAVYLPTREPTPGESPMIRTWKMLAAAALLTAAPVPAPAGETPSPNKEVLKKIEDLRLTVESLKTKVDSVNANANYKEVLADLKRVEKVLFEHIAKVNRDLSVDLNALKDTQLKQKIELQGMTAKVKGLEDELDLLTDRLSKLRKQLVDVPVAAATPTVDKVGLDDIRTRLSAIEKALAGLSSKERVAFSPPLSAAKIVLRNEYPALALFTVNGQKYRLEPNQTIVLTDIPAGETTYEAIFDGFGPRGMRIVTLRPNETMTLTAR